MARPTGPRRIAIVAAAMAVIASLAAACGAGGDSSDSSSGGTPHRGGSIAIAASNPTTLNPFDGANASVTDNAFYFNLFWSPLVKVSAKGLEPGLAASWTQPNPQTLILKLQANAKFSDGSPITADDVVASWNQEKASGDPSVVALFNTIKAVKAVDTGTVEIDTSAPDAALLSNLSLIRIVPKSAAGNPAFYKQPISSGPFVFVSWTPNSQMVVKANDNYWGGRPYLDQITIRVIPEAASEVAALKSGEIKLAWNLPPDQVESLASSDEVAVKNVQGYTYYSLYLNDRSQYAPEPLKNKNVRQALWYAIDFPTIVNSLFSGGAAKVATSPLPEAVQYHQNQTPYTYDVNKAKQLLAAGGYPQGFKLTFNLAADYGPNIVALAKSIASYWKAIGVDTALNITDRATFIAALVPEKYEAEIYTASVRTGDADYQLNRLWKCDSRDSTFCDPQYDQIVTQARQTLDPATRGQLYGQAQKMIWESASMIFPMTLATQYVVSNSLQGLNPPPTGYPDLDKVWIK